MAEDAGDSDSYVTLEDGDEEEREAVEDAAEAGGKGDDGAVDGEPPAVDPTEGCCHYRRGCAIIAVCCDKRYGCRLCHNEKEEHEIDRFATKEVVCRSCDTRQEIAAQCSQCRASFGNYVCLKCRLWDYDDKKQWHCDGCGICRVGGQENFFHCDRCKFCLAISQKDTHRCVASASRNVCAVCFGDLHDSRIPLHVPKCGHPIHTTCWRMMLKHHIFTCATCKESTVDADWEAMDRVVERILAENPIPEDQIQTVEIVCNDCHKKNMVKDYLMGLFKCPECGGYNTQR